MPSSSGAGRTGIQRERFAMATDGRTVDAYVLTSATGIRMKCIGLGGIIVSLEVPDRDGVLADVVGGYDRLEDYIGDARYFGTIVGRYANRIADARFTLDGETCVLAANDGPNSLHGGRRGFNARTWTVEPLEADGAVGLVLQLTSADGDEGFPGALAARVTYALTGDVLAVDYHATCDRATHVNLSQHSYFNLAGHDRGDILGHELTLFASRFTPVDAGLIPTGELREVRGTPFDFCTPSLIGLRGDWQEEQLRFGHGYDHNWVIDRATGEHLARAARLRDPRSGRTLELHTTEPGVQFYAGNLLDGGPVGKGGRVYRRNDLLALEPQHFPNSPNEPAFPSTVLRPGESYSSRSEYRFSVI